MKNKIYYLLLLLFTAARLQAQSLERQVIGSAGIYQTAAWGSLSATTGECITNTFSASSVVLTQGFQQPLPSDLMVYNVPSNNISIEVFPNPASDLINVAINTNDPDKHYSVTLFDLPGQLLKLPCQNFSSGTTIRLTFDLRPIANGTYLIQINDERNVQVKTIKFIKIN
jgi:hypothetical protein